jgi:hypothetical protein
MQKTILEMAERLKFDKLTIGQLKQLSEYVLELEEIARIDKQRISNLEVALDLSSSIINSYDSINWHG